MRALIAAAVCTIGLTATFSASAAGISNGVVKIGVLTDMSGPFSDWSGNGSLTAVQMAVADFGGKVAGLPIEIVSADHQNKTDVGLSIARQWYENGKVDAIFDISNSVVALAVMGLTKEKNKIVVLGGVSTPRVTEDACTPNSIQYIYDANALSNVIGKALVKQGGKSWYFITVDFAFGIGLEKTTTTVVEQQGGKVLGSVRHPLNTADFSSYLLKAQASGANVIALANSGTDTVNAIKGASEFGLSNGGKQHVTSLLTFITDVNSMGLDQAGGLVLTTPFYWDADDASRKFAKRFFDRTKRMPTMVQAGMYSAVTHYLQAIAATGTDDTATVMAKMKSTPINDFFSRNGHIRHDGLALHDMYLMQVKTTGESKGPWDYYKQITTVPASEAFSPEKPGACKM
ncbi:ABC transporter substrate-binding protein [Paraburkholderia sp. CNPSo 3157]|uniref:ABC transporter substrate-binding protein n=1 Tax=Paraburkholderia franconis TaxID=2654983 RepID=A0A7X1THF2_9BURK|nr:ABC transporter substrate-binding protein [Paraburkholderia franconis]